MPFVRQERLVTPGQSFSKHGPLMAYYHGPLRACVTIICRVKPPTLLRQTPDPLRQNPQHQSPGICIITSQHRWFLLTKTWEPGFFLEKRQRSLMGAAKIIPRQECIGERESTPLTHGPLAANTTKAGPADRGGGWAGPQDQGWRQGLSYFSSASVVRATVTRTGRELMSHSTSRWFSQPWQLGGKFCSGVLDYLVAGY